MKPEEMIKDIAHLYGRGADEWIALLPAGSHSDRKAWLMEQGLHSNHAGAVLWWEKNGAAIEDGGGELIDRQYAGPKAALRPIYERVAEVIGAFGEVEVGPRGTYVSFGRPKQFALVQPSTKTRVDVGLRLPCVPVSDRLADAGSFGSGNITHRVGLAAVEDVDAQLEGWLRATASAGGLVTASLATRAADPRPSARRPSSRARGRRRARPGRRRSRARGGRGGPRRPRATRARR